MIRIFTENNPDVVYENPEEIKKRWIESITREFVEENTVDVDLLKIALDTDWYDDEYIYDTKKTDL